MPVVVSVRGGFDKWDVIVWFAIDLSQSIFHLFVFGEVAQNGQAGFDHRAVTVQHGYPADADISPIRILLIAKK